MRFTVLALLLLAAPAWGADPECSDPDIVWPPGVIYDATDGYIEFCSPIQQPDGEPIPEGIVTACSIDVGIDGEIDRTVAVERNGQYFSVNFTASQYHGEHSVKIECALADGRTNTPYQFVADFCEAPVEGPIEVDTVFLVQTPETTL